MKFLFIILFVSSAIARNVERPNRFPDAYYIHVIHCLNAFPYEDQRLEFLGCVGAWKSAYKWTDGVFPATDKETLKKIVDCKGLHFFTTRAFLRTCLNFAKQGEELNEIELQEANQCLDSFVRFMDEKFKHCEETKGEGI